MISIVVPAYNEAANIEVLYRALCAELETLSRPWELVIVDDGSADDSWSRIAALAAADGRVRGVRLSRNFGHQNALFAGLGAATGAAVVTMDADLQHPPALIPELVRQWQQGFQIVHAVRSDPPSVSRFKRMTSRLYYRLFSYLSGVEIEAGSADFRLLDRSVLDEILKFNEEGLFLRGLVRWVGYSTTSVPFAASERHAGRSAYSLRKMLTLGWHGVSSFSLMPLRIASIVGLCSSAIAFIGIGYATLGWWIDDDHIVPGWASTLAIVSFFFALLFGMLVVLAEYIGRIVLQVRGRPRFLVRETTRTAANVHRLPGRPPSLPATPPTPPTPPASEPGTTRPFRER